MDLGLQDRVALVVGGTGLIGQAIVERLRAEGATAVVAARHATEGIILDAGDISSVTAAIAQLMERHNRLDALVVAAAPSAQTLDASRHADPSQVLNAIDAKAMTFLRLANAALPIMTKAGYGRIVGVSGQNAYLTGSVTASVPKRHNDHRCQEPGRQRRRLRCHRQHRQPQRRLARSRPSGGIRPRRRVESRRDSRPDRLLGLASRQSDLG